MLREAPVDGHGGRPLRNPQGNIRPGCTHLILDVLAPDANRLLALMLDGASHGAPAELASGSAADPCAHLRRATEGLLKRVRSSETPQREGKRAALQIRETVRPAASLPCHACGVHPPRSRAAAPCARHRPARSRASSLHASHGPAATACACRCDEAGMRVPVRPLQVVVLEGDDVAVHSLLEPGAKPQGAGGLHTDRGGQAEAEGPRPELHAIAPIVVVSGVRHRAGSSCRHVYKPTRTSLSSSTARPLTHAWQRA
jgi:hypothetical protein